MAEGARMSGIRQSLQGETPSLLYRAALLRGQAERASHNLRGTQGQQQMYGRRSAMHKVG